MTRRTRLDVLNDMLVAIQKDQGEMKPTHLMYKANLSHKLLNKHLDYLTSKNLVKEVHKDKKHRLIVLTDKGREFIVKFRKIKEFKESFGL